MLTWAIVLMLAALIFFVLELFIPSGGLLAVMSTGSLIGGVIALFIVDTTAGMIGLLVALIAVPAAIVTALRVFPETPIGKRLILADAQPAGTKVTLDKARDEDPAALVGATGEAVTHLRPVGICLIGGKRLECISESGVIDPGRKVAVTAVRGIEVRVRLT